MGTEGEEGPSLSWMGWRTKYGDRVSRWVVYGVVLVLGRVVVCVALDGT